MLLRSARLSSCCGGRASAATCHLRGGLPAPNNLRAASAASQASSRAPEAADAAAERATAAAGGAQAEPSERRAGGGAPAARHSWEPPARGVVVELTCDGLSASGEGVCRTSDGFVVFVPRAVPGEQLTALVHRLERNRALARKLDVLAPSPHAAQPPCPHFGSCGGCTSQHLAYAAQLQAKHSRVMELMQRIGGVADAARLMRAPLACPEPFRYRNKMTFTCSTRVDALAKRDQADAEQAQADFAAQPTVGLHALEEPGRLVEVRECWLQDVVADRILALARAHIPVVQKRGKLLVEKLAIKRGSRLPHSGGKHMLILHTWTRPRPKPPTPEQVAETYRELVEALVREVPSISIHECRAVAGREKAFPVLTRLHGSDYLEHTVAGVAFRASPLSFFQTNPHQAASLVELVHMAAGLRAGDLLLDLYCGVGLLGVSLARRQLDARRPVRLAGFDIYNKSVKDARANAKRAGLDPRACDLRSADLGQPTLGAPERADVVVADPARAGLAPSTVEFLRRCAARTLVYVSCDAATQARDVRLLTDVDNPRSWRLESVQVCDMFPQTAHAESVAVLRRNVGSLPPYQRPPRREMRRFKRQRLHKATVPSADLPWLEGGAAAHEEGGAGLQ